MLHHFCKLLNPWLAKPRLMWSLSQTLHKTLNWRNSDLSIFQNIIWQVRKEGEERSTQDNSFLYKCQLQVSPTIKQNKYFLENKTQLWTRLFFTILWLDWIFKLNEIIEEKIPSSRYQYLRSKFNIEPNSNSSESRLGLRICHYCVLILI